MNQQVEAPVEGQLIQATKQAIATLNPFETELAEFRERYDGIVYQLDDPDQNKAARSDRLAIGKVVARLDRQHKAVKEPLLEASRMLDGRRKEIKDGLLEVQGRIKSQIEAHEAKEQARIDGHFERIEEIRDSGTFAPDFTPTASQVELALDGMRKTIIDDSWEEFKAEALLAKTETIEALKKLLAERQQHEAEQAELARLRAEKEERERADREARIAAEAAEKAKREAEEAAEKARLDAERKLTEERERAERERQEAQEKAARALADEREAAARTIAEERGRAQRAATEERERILREQKEAESKAAAKREAEEARKAKQRHRSKIHGVAKRCLVDGGIEGETATRVIELVKDFKVAHMEIRY